MKNNNAEIKSSKSFKFAFVTYLLLLTWGVLFKFHLHTESIAKMTTERQIIMYPFDSSDGVILKSDLILNVLGFVPYGFLFGGINKKINSGLKLVIIFLTSAVFELIQYVFVIGYTDIKDLLCNTLGGLIGLILYWIFYVILKENGVAVLNRAVKFATLFVLLLIVVMMIYKI